MEWWKTLYDQRYNDAQWWSIPSSVVVQKQVHYFLLSSQLFSPKSILDLGAGTGLHVAFLQSLGFKTKGIEYSTTLVNKGLELNPNIDLSVGDMRDFYGADLFDAITYFDTSFGLFEDEINFNLLKSNYCSLRQKGVLMIDYLNPEYWRKKTSEIVLENYKERGGKLIRRYIYDERSNKITDKTKYISVNGDITQYPDQMLSIYKVEYLKNLLESIGFHSFVSYGSNGFTYPEKLTPVHDDSAFIQIVCKK